MKNYHPLKKIQIALHALALTDKCLLVFMIILMIQSAHNLFFHEITVKESHALDVVIRTTAAAIFGYFISANFQNGTQSAKKEKEQSKEEDAESVEPNHFQILIIASIGISSLLLLLIAHNFIEANSASVATISQLRDFVSGSVGFLIGHSTHQKKEP